MSRKEINKMNKTLNNHIDNMSIEELQKVYKVVPSEDVRRNLIKKLASKTMKEKWNKIKDFATHRINSGRCSFCEDAVESKTIAKGKNHECWYCLLPPYFCALHEDNLIKILILQRDKEKDVKKFNSILSVMKSIMKELATNGFVGNELKDKALKIIKNNK